MVVTGTTTSAATSGGGGIAQAAKARSVFSEQLATQERAGKTSTTVRKMRPILVPRAASTREATGTGTRTVMTAGDTLQRYGSGTLSTILARIRQA